MQNIDLSDNNHVLFLEESQMLHTLFDSWLSNVSARFATAPDEIPTELDSTIAIACLSQSLLGNDEEEIRKHILNRNPYCQLILIAPRSAFITPYENDYDAVLRRPIGKDELQSTIENRMKCSVYSTLLREFYDLNAKVLWVRREETTVDITSVDQEQVEERYRQLRSQLNQLQTELSTADIKSISQSIALHKRYLTEPTQDVENTATSKYQPRRCPNCKLRWGTDHGNELGEGVVSIGASVWKCARCNEIVHGLGDGDRRVTGL